jgi:hypothetical protein
VGPTTTRSGCSIDSRLERYGFPHRHLLALAGVSLEDIHGTANSSGDDDNRCDDGPRNDTRVGLATPLTSGAV